MNKSDKIIIFFYIFLAISYGFYVISTIEDIEKNLVKLVLPTKITEFETSRIVDLSNDKIFNLIVDIENYPKILPNNVINVIILNKTENIIIAEEEFIEAGIKTKLLVKHTITPFHEHIIEIINGDAKGTKIIQSFEPVNSQTKITTNVYFNLNGILSFVAFIPESNLVSAVNTVISEFVDYSQYDIFDEKVISLYQEILYRSADNEGLLHYSTLLRTDQITEQELRDILLNSNEKLANSKSIDELNDETITIINELYKKILLRNADPKGLLYFGILLESGTSPDEIRKILLESDEGQNISALHPIRSEINILYKSILNRFPDDSELDYYHKIIDDGLMTIDDVKKELEEYIENDSVEQ